MLVVKGNECLCGVEHRIVREINGDSVGQGIGWWSTI